MLVFLALLLVAALAWVGHACILTSALNYLYGRRLPKAVLKPWRFVTGGLILAFPWVVMNIENPSVYASQWSPGDDPYSSAMDLAMGPYSRQTHLNLRHYSKRVFRINGVDLMPS